MYDEIYDETYEEESQELDDDYYSDCIERAADMNEYFRGTE